MAVPASELPADAEERQDEESADPETRLWVAKAARPDPDAAALQASEQAGQPSLPEDGWEDELRSSAVLKLEDAKARREAGEQAASTERRELQPPAVELAEPRLPEIRQFSE